MKCSALALSALSIALISIAPCRADYNPSYWYTSPTGEESYAQEEGLTPPPSNGSSEQGQSQSASGSDASNASGSSKSSQDGQHELPRRQEKSEDYTPEPTIEQIIERNQQIPSGSVQEPTIPQIIKESDPSALPPRLRERSEEAAEQTGSGSPTQAGQPSKHPANRAPASPPSPQTGRPSPIGMGEGGGQGEPQEDAANGDLSISEDAEDPTYLAGQFANRERRHSSRLLIAESDASTSQSTYPLSTDTTIMRIFYDQLSPYGQQIWLQLPPHWREIAVQLAQQDLNGGSFYNINDPDQYVEKALEEYQEQLIQPEQ